MFLSIHIVINTSHSIHFIFNILLSVQEEVVEVEVAVVEDYLGQRESQLHQHQHVGLLHPQPLHNHALQHLCNHRRLLNRAVCYRVLDQQLHREWHSVPGRPLLTVLLAQLRVV